MKSFWAKHEKEVMRQLHLNPQPASGASWLKPEDGENNAIVAQLKSTKGGAITIRRTVIVDLINHALISHKVPVLVLDFVDSFLFVAFRIQDLEELSGKKDFL